MADALEEAFQRWLSTDNAIYDIKGKIDKLQTELLRAKIDANNAMLEVKDMVDTMRIEDGVIDPVIHGEYSDYEIYYTRPKTSVKIGDPEALPDHLRKAIYEPKLREIGDELGKIAKAGGDAPNWASKELGTPKLTYKIKARK